MTVFKLWSIRIITHKHINSHIHIKSLTFCTNSWNSAILFRTLVDKTQMPHYLYNRDNDDSACARHPHRSQCECAYIERTATNTLNGNKNTRNTLLQTIPIPIPILDQMTIVIKHVGERKRQNSMVGRRSTSKSTQMDGMPTKGDYRKLGWNVACMCCVYEYEYGYRHIQTETSRIVTKCQREENCVKKRKNQAEYWKKKIET